jgi:hypothetical protein
MVGKPHFIVFYNRLILLIKKNLQFGIIFEYIDMQLFSISDVRASFLPGFQLTRRYPSKNKTAL